MAEAPIYIIVKSEVCYACNKTYFRHQGTVIEKVLTLQSGERRTKKKFVCNGSDTFSEASSCLQKVDARNTSRSMIDIPASSLSSRTTLCWNCSKFYSEDFFQVEDVFVLYVFLEESFSI